MPVRPVRVIPARPIRQKGRQAPQAVLERRARVPEKSAHRQALEATVETLSQRVDAQTPEARKTLISDRLKAWGDGKKPVNRDEAIEVLLSADALMKARRPSRLLLRAQRQGKGPTVPIGRAVIQHLQQVIAPPPPRVRSSYLPLKD